jgi:hypothetical protein
MVPRGSGGGEEGVLAAKLHSEEAHAKGSFVRTPGLFSDKMTRGLWPKPWYAWAGADCLIRLSGSLLVGPLHVGHGLHARQWILPWSPLCCDGVCPNALSRACHVSCLQWWLPQATQF